MKDIIQKLGSDEFARCRVGVGRCAGAEAIDYVLGRPMSDERELLNDAIARARDAVLWWMDSGIEKAMNEFNGGLA